MVHIVIISLIILLVLINISAGAVAFIMRRDLIDCETNESPYCLKYICPNGKEATRDT